MQIRSRIARSPFASPPLRRLPLQAAEPAGAHRAIEEATRRAALARRATSAAWPIRWAPAPWRAAPGTCRSPRRRPTKLSLRALGHHAAVAASAGPYVTKPKAERRHSRHLAGVQHGEPRRRRRARPAGHADRRARPLRLPRAALGRQGRAARRMARATTAAITQKDVKPTPDSPLLKLGIEKDPADHHQRRGARREGARRRRPADEGGRNRHREAHRGDAQGAGPRQARHPARRRGLRAHRLGRLLEGPGYRQGLLRQGARPFLRRGEVPRRQAHRRDRPRHAVHRPGARGHARGQGRPRGRRARRASRSRCTTTC